MDKVIERLLSQVEMKFGQKPKTPSMFAQLSLDIQKESKANISISTLKRLWGYVNSGHVPSLETLSILSQYVGFRDWDDYRQEYSESDFVSGQMFNAESIEVGKRMMLSWLPNHSCVVEHLGHGSFQVKRAERCKLQVGDIFQTEIFGVGLPLYARNLMRNGVCHQLYVAGARTGLQQITFL